jgi:hypothetical protein
MKNEKAIKAIDVTSEEQLNLILNKGGILSNSPKEIGWLYHWWMEEFRSKPPIARQIKVVGDEGYGPALCFAVEQNKFVVYRLDEINWWFNKLGEIEEFSSFDQIHGYLKGLVNEDLRCWKEFVNWYRR